jgi:hypothetical protein
MATGAGENTFWIAATIMFDINTGEKREILLLANKVKDATPFTHDDAAKYCSFVKAREPNMVWSIEPYPTSETFRRRPYGSGGRFVIRGARQVG